MGDKVAGLRQDTDTAGARPGPLGLGAMADPLPADVDVASGRLVQPGQARQQGGLARPGGSDDGDGLTALDVEGHPAQGEGLLLSGAEEPVELPGVEGGRSAGSRPCLGGGGHHCHRSESLTMRQGSTLSAPVGPVRVRTTCRP